MTAFELTRYLDSCSDMLAVIGNLAALHAQHYDDAVALEAVDAIERLTTGISQKIWQKMTIVNSMLVREPVTGMHPMGLGTDAADPSDVSRSDG